MERKGLCLFKGEFHTLEGKKVQMVALPHTFQRLGQEDEYQEVYSKLVIEGYFKLPPWNLDYMRAYQELNIMDTNKKCWVTNIQGQQVKLTMSRRMVRVAASSRALSVDNLLRIRVKRRTMNCRQMMRMTMIPHKTQRWLGRPSSLNRKEIGLMLMRNLWSGLTWMNRNE